MYIDCLLQEFSAWCHGEAREDNPLAVFSPRHFSAYIDYKYMTQVFAECPHLLKEGIIKCVNFMYIYMYVNDLFLFIFALSLLFPEKF